MMDLIAERVLKNIMKAMLYIAIGIAIGLFWAYQQRAYSACMNTVHPAGWVEDNEGILAAMAKMGPRYGYMIKDRILYVDRGDGVWLRLGY